MKESTITSILATAFGEKGAWYNTRRLMNNFQRNTGRHGAGWEVGGCSVCSYIAVIHEAFPMRNRGLRTRWIDILKERLDQILLLVNFIVTEQWKRNILG
jgi:hypothetical protein